jgi:hypothetical protein
LDERGGRCDTMIPFGEAGLSFFAVRAVLLLSQAVIA